MLHWPVILAKVKRPQIRSWSDVITLGFARGIGDAFGKLLATAEGGFLAYVKLCKAASHGLVGGYSSMMNGGSFQSGFLSSFGTQLAGYGIDHIDPNNTGISMPRAVAAAMVGGTISEMGGGKFANGAITAAIQRMYNDDSHPGTQEPDAIIGSERAPGENTIVTDGLGGLKIQIEGNTHTVDLITEGMTKHEVDHIKQILKKYPDIAKGYNRGEIDAGYPVLTRGDFHHTIELRAKQIELNHLNRGLEPGPFGRDMLNTNQIYEVQQRIIILRDEIKIHKQNLKI